MVTGQWQLHSPVAEYGSQVRQPGTALDATQRSSVLRAADSAECSDGVSVAGGDGGVLLKGVAPPHVTLNQIVASVMPFMGIQVIALILLYLFPGIGLFLSHLL